MTTSITCKCVGCDSQGWDSYVVDGKIRIECTTCECNIEGNFVIGADGWIEQAIEVEA